MKPIYLLFFTLLFMHGNTSIAQIGWTWEELDSMPDRVANNAVAFGKDDVAEYVFSFGGIDSTKTADGIHKKAYRYTIGTDEWEEIAPLPFALSNIASGASTVENIIYIMGGYHVFDGGSETSSNEVIRYDPETNTYLENGAPIPVPIDDHVQAVWRDSLIFLVTGWSNTGNVPNVQIYNPFTDEWSAGTPVPTDNIFRAFGPSGEIIGDTIYYYGGASMGFNFPAQQILRKGIINPENPTEITWTREEDGPNQLYRSASLKYDDKVFWVGGSAISYNYNGVAYNGSGGVPPLYQIMRYHATDRAWNAGLGAPFGVMDLRGIAQISDTEWIICGGMEEDQYVSRKTFLLTYDPIVGNVTDEAKKAMKIIQNKVIYNGQPDKIEIMDISGRVVHKLNLNTMTLPELSGVFFVAVYENGQRTTLKIVR